MIVKALKVSAIAAGLMLAVAAPASAVMPAPAVSSGAVTAPLAEPARNRVFLYGHHHHGHKQQFPSAAYHQPGYVPPYFNPPQYFNPSEPPHYDGLRGDYAGYGLYR